jgi:hypothetical protein
MYLQLAEGENDGNYQALAEGAGILDNYVYIPAGFLPEFEKDTWVRADYFNKFDPTTAEALINALMSQQTVGLSAIGIAAIATGGLKFAKNIIEKRKEKVAAGTAKPLFKPGGVFDKIKTKIQGGAMQQKDTTAPEEKKGLPNVNIQAGIDGQNYGLTFQPKPEEEKEPTFFAKYKTPLLIGGGLLAVGAIYMITRKKGKRR